MKYTQNKRSLLSKSLKAVFGVCLAAIAVTAFSTFGNINKPQKKVKENSGNNNSYESNVSSYIESVPESQPEETVTESTAETASDVPDTRQDEYFARPVEGAVLKEFSTTELNYSETFEDYRIHRGLDLACDKGTSVSACNSGTVEEIVNDTVLGKGVIIGNSTVSVALYGLDNITVNKGDNVAVGDIIGVSSTVPGESKDTPHIHIEIKKDGEFCNPKEILGIE